MSTEVIVFSGAGLVVNLLIGLVMYLAKQKMARTDGDIEATNKRVDRLADEMSEFRDNYLDRFERVNKNIVDSRELIIDKFHTLEMSLKK